MLCFGHTLGKLGQNRVTAIKDLTITSLIQDKLKIDQNGIDDDIVLMLIYD